MSSELAAVLTYALLTVLWGLVLTLYVRQRQASRDDALVQGLLAVLALDAFKSFVESLYFGLVWGGNYGLLPQTFKDLGRADFLTAVKLVNVAVVTVILGWLIRRWVPTELGERRARREAETRLREELEKSLAETKESEQRFRIAAEVSRDVVWDWDLRTGTVETTGRIAELLGRDPATWPKTIEPWNAHVHPDDAPRVQQQIAAFLKSREPVLHLTLRMMHADGRALSFASSATMLRDAAGEPARLIGITRDLTPDQEAERTRLAAQKLESVGVLAGGVAHDFNNLLAVVSASLGVAQVDPGLSSGSRESLGLAATAVQRAASLTRQLLAYAGRGTSQRVAVDVNSAVRDMAELLSVSISKRIRLKLELLADLPPVLADEGQLQQAIVNLVTNAAEAIGASEGTITIKTATRELNAKRAVVLEVRDSGGGMTAEVRARAFDPFFTTKGAGRGLGLAALAGIVRSHDALIDLTTSAGGTAFTITWTVLAPSAPAPKPVVERAKGSLSARVLLVDDEALLRRSASRLLTQLGCSVVEASDGEEAVDAVRKAPTGFDLVLMDVTMPRLGGVAAARQMLTLAPTLPVVLSSGYARDALDAEGELPSTVRTLGKPYRAEELERTIREAIGQPSPA